MDIPKFSMRETLVPANCSEILCHVCLGSGEYIHRNYLYKEISRETCSYCKGTGKGLINTDTGAFLPAIQAVKPS